MKFKEKKMNIGIPKCCPVCGGKLEILETSAGIKDLFCVNPSCPAKTNEMITSFLAKLGVMGVSNTTMANWGIHTMADLLGFKADPKYKNEVKFVKELSNKLWKCPKRKLLHAMSAFVPGIGEKEMAKFEEKYNDCLLLGKDTPGASTYVKEQLIIDNIPTISENFRMVVEDPRYEGVEEVIEVDASATLGTICFTGKLETMTRSVAQAKAKKLGYAIADGVSKDLGTLVVADAGLQGAPSSKLKKARSLGIRIMSETEFNNL